MVQHINEIFVNGYVKEEDKKRKCKSYFSLCPKRRSEIDTLIIQQMNANQKLNQILLEHDVQIRRVEIIILNEDKKLKNMIEIKAINKTQSQIDFERKTLIERISMAKDICFISDKSYALFKILTQLEIPTIHYIRTQRLKINKEMPAIFSNKFGAFFNSSEKIIWVL